MIRDIPGIPQVAGSARTPRGPAGTLGVRVEPQVEELTVALPPALPPALPTRRLSNRGPMGLIYIYIYVYIHIHDYKHHAIIKPMIKTIAKAIIIAPRVIEPTVVIGAHVMDWSS